MGKSAAKTNSLGDCFFVADLAGSGQFGELSRRCGPRLPSIGWGSSCMGRGGYMQVEDMVILRITPWVTVYR